MKALVTGGAGFIGSHLAEELAKNNEVIIVDDLSSGNLENIRSLIKRDNVKFIQGSLMCRSSLERIMEDVDYVFHQAAIPAVSLSVEKPSATNDANINGTLNVLIASKDADVKKVVFASSSSVYGNSPELPKREDMNPDPLSPYAVTKITGEYYCKVFCDVYGLKTVSLRYFNVFGPRQDPVSEYAAVVPKFINNILFNKPLTIYGNGEQSRDFVFVKDVVRANLLACRTNATGSFNIAGGKRVTVNELVHILKRIICKNIEHVYRPPRVGDVNHSFADIMKAKNVLGYEPRYSLKEGLMETIKWFADRV